MKTIYLCENCYSAWGGDGSDTKCPKCGAMIYDTGITQEEWRSKTEEEKSKIKDDFKKRAIEVKEAREKTISEIKKSSNYTSSSAVKTPILSIDGSRGRRIDIYTFKCVIKTSVTIGSVITRNATDGEKTIYFSDVSAVQFKEPGLTLGYLQLETAGASMNNLASNFFNENTFTFEGEEATEAAREAYKLIIEILDEYKMKLLKK